MSLALQKQKWRSFLVKIYGTLFPKLYLNRANKQWLAELSKHISDGAVIKPRLGSPIVQSPFCRYQRTKWAKYTAEQFRGSFTEHELAPLLRSAGIELPEEPFKCTKVPLAILTVPESLLDFLVKHPKLLKMVNKCKKRGYRVRLFDYNNKLDDIQSINTSKDVRQGMEMSASYRVYPDPLTPSPNYVSSVRVEYIGVFDGERLVAYCWFESCGEVLFINRLLGHGDVLQDGVMYLLFLGLIQYCMTIPDIKYVNYLTLNSSTKGLDEFKTQVGFEKKVVIVPASLVEQESSKPVRKTIFPGAMVDQARRASRLAPWKQTANGNFDLGQYVSFVSAIQDRGVRFSSFSDFCEAVGSARGVHFIKHDIHEDVPTSLRMAELEQRLGVKSTYFMMPLHPINESFYERPDTWRMLRDIQGLGHDIGIHLDLFEIFETDGDLVQGANKFINEFREHGLSVRCANTHGNTIMWQQYHFDQRLFFREFFYESEGWHPAWKGLIGRWSWEDIDVDYWADTIVSVRGRGNLQSEYIVTDNSGAIKVGRLRQHKDWDLDSGQYQLSDDFVARAADHIADNTCLYLIHPQFYR